MLWNYFIRTCLFIIIIFTKSAPQNIVIGQVMQHFTEVVLFSRLKERKFPTSHYEALVVWNATRSRHLKSTSRPRVQISWSVWKLFHSNGINRTSVFSRLHLIYKTKKFPCPPRMLWQSTYVFTCINNYSLLLIVVIKLYSTKYFLFFPFSYQKCIL